MRGSRARAGEVEKAQMLEAVAEMGSLDGVEAWAVTVVLSDGPERDAIDADLNQLGREFSVKAGVAVHLKKATKSLLRPRSARCFVSVDVDDLKSFLDFLGSKVCGYILSDIEAVAPVQEGNHGMSTLEIAVCHTQASVRSRQAQMSLRKAREVEESISASRIQASRNSHILLKS